MVSALLDWAVRTRILRLSSSGSILCYHSIIAPDLPSRDDVHVTLKAFQHAVALTRDIGELVPLQELVQRHQEGKSTANLTAITFDDAYQSLLTVAGSFIHSEQVPVTVFVVTDAAAQGARFWWDRIADLFPSVPLDRWRRFEDACGLPHEYSVGQPPAFGPLRPLRQWILAEYQGRWPLHLAPLLSDLEREFRCQTQHRAMNFDELERFTAVPWIDIGVHTVSHPVLPLLPDAELVEEIRASYRQLQNRFARVVPALADPFGLYDERTARLAREAGMGAFLTLGGTTLRYMKGSEVFPRVCMGRRLSRGKLVLSLSGVRERLRRMQGGESRYPTLPSPTS